MKDTVMQTELDSHEGKISETKPIIVIFWDGGGWGGGLQFVNVFDVQLPNQQKNSVFGSTPKDRPPKPTFYGKTEKKKLRRVILKTVLQQTSFGGFGAKNCFGSSSHLKKHIQFCKLTVWMS